MSRSIDYCIHSCNRGHHIYKEIWTPYITEELRLEEEEDNLYDQHTVAVVRNKVIVGHMPCVLARVSFFYHKRGGTIKAIVTGHRQQGNGFLIEVPCDYIFTGSPRLIRKIKELTNSYT